MPFAADDSVASRNRQKDDGQAEHEHAGVQQTLRVCTLRSPGRHKENRADDGQRVLASQRQASE